MCSSCCARRLPPSCSRPASPARRRPAPSPPPQSLIDCAATAPNLVSLSLAPSVWPYFTQLDPFQVPAWLTPAQPDAGFTGNPRMSPHTTATLISCKLPNLQHLAIAIDAGGQAEFFGARLSALTSLDLLSGAPVQSKALQVRAGRGGGDSWHRVPALPCPRC